MPIVARGVWRVCTRVCPLCVCECLFMRSFVRGAVFFAVAGMASIPLSLVLFRVLSIMCPLALWLVPCGTGG